MAKQITDEEYNQVSEMYDKFIADPNQDPAKVAKVQDLWNQVQEEYRAQKASEPKINDAWGNQDGTSTFSYDNGTTNRFDQQGNKLSIDNMYQNNDGTVTTVYNNGSREIIDQGGNNVVKTNEQLAREVLQGKRGNGQARKNALANAGYDYNAVQRIVNNSVRRPRQVPPTPQPESTPTSTSVPTQQPVPETIPTKVTPSWIFKDAWPKVNIPTNNNIPEDILRTQPEYWKNRNQKRGISGIWIS